MILYKLLNKSFSMKNVTFDHTFYLDIFKISHHVLKSLKTLQAKAQITK